MILIAFVPTILFCSATTGRCQTAYGPYTEPTHITCVDAMPSLEVEAVRILPPDYYLVHKECLEVFQ